jgi:hypothetical protein
MPFLALTLIFLKTLRHIYLLDSCTGNGGSGTFFGRPPFLPFSRDACAFFLLLIEPSRAAAALLMKASSAAGFLVISRKALSDNLPALRTPDGRVRTLPPASLHRKPKRLVMRPFSSPCNLLCESRGRRTHCLLFGISYLYPIPSVRLCQQGGCITF